MSNEELVLQAKAGSGEAMAQLWQQLQGYIRRIMWRYSNLARRQGLELEDLIQEAYIALDTTVKSYPDDCEIAFMACLYYPLKDAARKALGLRRKLRPYISSLDEPLPGTEDFTLADTLEDPTATEALTDLEDVWYREQLREVLFAGIKKLRRHEKEVLYLRYYQRRTQQEAADIVGFKLWYLRQVEENALGKMRRPAIAYRLLPFLRYYNTFYSYEGRWIRRGIKRQAKQMEQWMSS